MSVIRGVDGSKAGWLCLSVLPGETCPTVAVFGRDARTLFAEPAIITTIHIPIGLPSAGTRRVDSKARGFLGPLKSSVFPAPVRAANLCLLIGAHKRPLSAYRKAQSR